MSESTNKAEQRESGYYWVAFKVSKDETTQRVAYYANDLGCFFLPCDTCKWYDIDFESIDPRPIQRHQPEILAECLESL